MNRCLGTLRMRSSTRRSTIPWSCRRCTRRSRVRAEVMPMPLSRGPSMKLLKLEPFLQLGQRRVTGQIHLQGSDRGKPFGHGMKIRARPCVLAIAGITHPVHIAPPRILCPHDGLAAMAAAEAGDPDAAYLAIGEVRHIDVEDDRPYFRPLKTLLRHSPHQLRCHLRSAGKIARAARLDAQRHG